MTKPRPKALWKQIADAKASQSPKELKTPPRGRTVARRAIPARSVKMKKRMASYLLLKTTFLEQHPACAVMHYEPATEVHHVRGRAGELLLDTRHWLAVSAPGHRWIHSNPDAARSKGYLCEKGLWNKPDKTFSRSDASVESGRHLVRIAHQKQHGDR